MHAMMIALALHFAPAPSHVKIVSGDKCDPAEVCYTVRSRVAPDNLRSTYHRPSWGDRLLFGSGAPKIEPKHF